MALGSSLLAIVQSVCKRMNFPPPQAVAGSSDPAYQQMMELLNEEIEEVSTRKEWSDFIYDVTWTTLAREDQENIDIICFPNNGTNVPGPTTGRVAYIVNDTLWNQTTRLPVFGPISPQVWEAQKAMPLTGLLMQYRIMQNRLHLYPVPPAGQVLAFEVASEFMVIDDSGASRVFKKAFSKDTDQVPLHDSHMKAALRWRWKKEKGLSYAEDKARYENILADRMSRDGTRKILSLSSDENDQIVGPGLLVPSGSWNLP